MTTSQIAFNRILEYRRRDGLPFSALRRRWVESRRGMGAALSPVSPCDAAAGNKPNARSPRSAGFTLIELLLVMVILAILASLIIPMFVGRAEQARVTAAQTDISNISSALDTFEIDNGHYPTTSEGLIALVRQPPGMPNWHGPYLKGSSVPVDPWGHPYQYRSPGEHSKDGYDLWSLGPTGQQGGAGEITNWGPSQ